MVGPGAADFTAALCAGDPDVGAGELTFMAAYSELSTKPPGVYTFTITATTAGGDTVATGTFTWTLVDPCLALDTFAATA